MGITTKKGDKAYTSTASGGIVLKSSKEIDVVGIGDELVCFIGSALLLPSRFRVELEEIQKIVFSLNFTVSSYHNSVLPENYFSHDFEQKHCDYINKITIELDKLVDIDKFILPSECELSSRLDIARACARRYERSIVKLFEGHVMPNAKIKVKRMNVTNNGTLFRMLEFANRLSDVLYMMARVEGENQATNIRYWNS